MHGLYAYGQLHSHGYWHRLRQCGLDTLGGAFSHRQLARTQYCKGVHQGHVGRAALGCPSGRRPELLPLTAPAHYKQSNCVRRIAEGGCPHMNLCTRMVVWMIPQDAFRGIVSRSPAGSARGKMKRGFLRIRQIA